MTHPRMFAITDPVLARVRDLALALPEAVEVEAWGRPTFRAGTPMFAVYGVHDGHDTGLVFKPDPDERPALEHDERFYAPPYHGPAGWLAIDLAADSDWDEVRELLEGSFRQVANRRQLAALEPA
ncbi:MmcQ/YjbR family DNA-binding protein [Cellulomonas sp. PhB150]|uniref:MmcQ/YjbR family DNA-binding protein n=1 Tax=Cellulomonas sp. PhB150 TaxID=2485188 RepID=UPI000F496D79|nr:MmcQ/YjbR family DNA-binding protein [Cellulomonas sp. PhB150]